MKKEKEQTRKRVLQEVEPKMLETAQLIEQGNEGKTRVENIIYYDQFVFEMSGLAEMRNIGSTN